MLSLISHRATCAKVEKLHDIDYCVAKKPCFYLDEEFVSRVVTSAVLAAKEEASK